MRIAVFGTGGVGGYFGGRLAQAGEDVVFIARGQRLEALRTRGLTIESPLGDVTLSRIDATDDPSTVGPVDLVLVATKAWQVEEAAQAMAPMVGPETTVLPLQNGVDATPTLAVVLGHDRVLTAMCRVIAYVAEPGVIRHGGIEPTIVFGETDNRRSERVERILSVLTSAPGVVAIVPDDIHVEVWVKFAMIVALSGVGAVTRAPFGVTRSVPETRRLIERLLEEVFAVARASGVTIPSDTLSKCIAYFDTLPPDGTASMQRDIAEGRPSEIEAQSGAVVRLGRQCQVPTPVNEFIYDVIRPLELRARDAIEFV